MHRRNRSTCVSQDKSIRPAARRDSSRKPKNESIVKINKGNHYHLTVFTDWDEDIFVDTNDVWDDGDRVGIRIAPENIRVIKR